MSVNAGRASSEDQRGVRPDSAGAQSDQLDAVISVTESGSTRSRGLDALPTDERDIRRVHPRFGGENFARNLELLDHIESIARAKGVTAAQLSIAWLLHQDPEIVPIPGTRRRECLEENSLAVEIELSADELKVIDQALPRGGTAGDRYADTSNIGT